jgi:hypothetical protein
VALTDLFRGPDEGFGFVVVAGRFWGACLRRQKSRSRPAAWDRDLFRAIGQSRKHYLLDGVFLDRVSGDPRQVSEYSAIELGA